MSKRFKPQEQYAQRMRDQGCVKISAWVPEKNRDELLGIAEDMRKENTVELRRKDEESTDR